METRDLAKEPIIMRFKPSAVLLATAILAIGGASWAGVAASSTEKAAVHMPWKQAGLSERQAASHLLNRFAFGPRPGEVDAVVKMGLDRWFERQLGADLPDAKALEDLRDLPALTMSTAQILKTYPPAGVVSSPRPSRPGSSPTTSSGAISI